MLGFSALSERAVGALPAEVVFVVSAPAASAPIGPDDDPYEQAMARIKRRETIERQNRMLMQMVMSAVTSGELE